MAKAMGLCIAIGNLGTFGRLAPRSLTRSKVWSERLLQHHVFLSGAAAENKAAVQSSIKISDACVQQMKKVSSNDEFLRVIVEGGGCSGFTYKFELDTRVREDDLTFEKDGVKVIVDEDALELIKGSTIDYHKELIKSAFRIKDNPQSKANCSCGVSFSVDL